MSHDINSQPHTAPELEGRHVKLNRLSPGSIFRHDNGALYTVLSRGNLNQDVVEFKVEAGHSPCAHIKTGEVSALWGEQNVEPQFLTLVGLK